MDRFGTLSLGAFLSSVSQSSTPVVGTRAMVNERQERVLLGRIAGAHGLRGEVVVQSYTAIPEDIAAYGALADADGSREFELRVMRVSDKGVVARIPGVDDRTKAEALKGTELWLPRDRLPAPDEEEYYHADLIGLAARDPDGREIGRIVAVQNYGAGDLLEIRLSGARRTELIPFTQDCVPKVAVAEGHVIVILPAVAGEEDDNRQDDPAPPRKDD